MSAETLDMARITPVLKTLFRGVNLAVIVPALLRIVIELRDYWPLTVRQIYYQGVAQRVFANRLGNYKKASDILTTLRREDLLPWHAIEDRTRRTIDKRGVPDLQAFVGERIRSAHI